MPFLSFQFSEYYVSIIYQYNYVHHLWSNHVSIFEMPIELCYPDCTNGGTCYEQDGSLLCSCLPGYTGQACEIGMKHLSFISIFDL